MRIAQGDFKGLADALGNRGADLVRVAGVLRRPATTIRNRRHQGLVEAIADAERCGADAPRAQLGGVTRQRR